MSGPASLESMLKAAVELVEPDLRGCFSFELKALVTHVYDVPEDGSEDYRVDLIVGDNASIDDDQSGRSLPNVPVDAVFAGDGYGVFVIPEVGQEIIVGFIGGDPNRPHVTAHSFDRGNSPKGFKAGSIAIVGKQNQRIHIKPDTSEVSIWSASEKRLRRRYQSHTGGDENCRIDGSERVTIGKDASRTIAGKLFESVARLAERRFGELIESVSGNASKSVGGKLTETLGGLARTVLGGASESVAFDKKTIVGGDATWIAAGAGPAPHAVNIIAAVKGVLIDALAGVINIGSPTSGSPINLGGLNLTLEPAVCGATLAQLLGELIALLQAQPLQLGNLGAPTAPFPATAAQLASMQGRIATMLSTRVFVAKK